MTERGSGVEHLVRDALRSAAEDAPGAHGLAAGARRRARTRRRTTVAAVAVVALVGAAAAVPAAMVLGGSDGNAPVAQDPRGQEASPAPPGWRAESWRDLEVHVPDSWGEGSMATWCLDSPAVPEGPLVDRQEGFVAAIDCSPSLGQGMRFLDPAVEEATSSEPVEVPDGSERYPAGSWVGSFVGEHAGVEVVAPSRALAHEVLGSVREVQVVDSRGCVAGIYANTDFRGPDPVDGPLTVCRYASADDDGSGASYWLAESTTLTAGQSDAVREAVAAAPRGQGAFTRCEGDSEFFLLIGDDTVYAWVSNGRCGEHSVMTAAADGVTYHQPTEELLRLLGSPWGNMR
jgi:hypothetical protein